MRGDTKGIFLVLTSLRRRVISGHTASHLDSSGGKHYGKSNLQNQNHLNIKIYIYTEEEQDITGQIKPRYQSRKFNKLNSSAIKTVIHLFDNFFF